MEEGKVKRSAQAQSARRRLPVTNHVDFTVTVLDLKATEGLILESSNLLMRAENLAKGYDYNGAIE